MYLHFQHSQVNKQRTKYQLVQKLNKNILTVQPSTPHKYEHRENIQTLISTTDLADQLAHYKKVQLCDANI